MSANNDRESERTPASGDENPATESGAEQTPKQPMGEVGDNHQAANAADNGASGDDLAANIPEDTDQLIAALLEARHQAESHWETVLRTQAEMENLRKRVTRDVENAHKYGLERFLEELLPVRDSMELGLAATHEDGAQVEQLREGVELTLKMLTGTLEKFGVEVIDPIDSAFDPEFHQAMSMQEVQGVESGTVTMVMQKGFVLNGRLVRPALVMVAK